MLSQEEINALLSAYESADAQHQAKQGARCKPEMEVRLYDFARPDRFSKEHLRGLQTIHESYANELSGELSSLYGVPTRVELISIDQAVYKQFRGVIPSRTLLAEVTIHPMNLNILLGVSSSVVGAWVDYLCGGSPNLPAAPSELTPIDIAVAKNVLQYSAQIYTGCWSGSVQATAEVQKVTDSEFSGEIQIGASETVLVCSLEVQAGSSVGMMTICIPARCIDAMMPANAQTTSAAVKHDLSSLATSKALNPVALTCRVLLGDATIALDDLSNLEVGDVLRTNRRADSEIEFYVGDRHVFDCRPGRRSKNISVVISNTKSASQPDIPLPLPLEEEVVEKVA